MLALSVRYLMGWAMVTDPTDRSRPEWPPHPDRVFMALAAAYFEGGRPDAERQTLTWLERQDPPSLRASEHAERSPVTAFVPVNDSALPRTRPGRRSPRTRPGAHWSSSPSTARGSPGSSRSPCPATPRCT